MSFFDALNPLEWVRVTQDERSSGFRPYLIFLVMVLGFALVTLAAFPNAPFTAKGFHGWLALRSSALSSYSVLKPSKTPIFAAQKSTLRTSGGWR